MWWNVPHFPPPTSLPPFSFLRHVKGHWERGMSGSNMACLSRSTRITTKFFLSVIRTVSTCFNGQWCCMLWGDIVQHYQNSFTSLYIYTYGTLQALFLMNAVLRWNVRVLVVLWECPAAMLTVVGKEMSDGKRAFWVLIIEYITNIITLQNTPVLPPSPTRDFGDIAGVTMQTRKGLCQGDKPGTRKLHFCMSIWICPQ